MRFAAGGTYGAGNYFAVHANYSCGGFVHTEPDGTKGVFYASVLVGEPARNVDQSRNKPPLKGGN